MLDQNATSFGRTARPVFRIAFPAWTVSAARGDAGDANTSLTREELRTLFDCELGDIKHSRCKMTENERRQVEINRRIRAALRGNDVMDSIHRLAS